MGHVTKWGKIAYNNTIKTDIVKHFITQNVMALLTVHTENCQHSTFIFNSYVVAAYFNVHSIIIKQQAAVMHEVLFI